MLQSSIAFSGDGSLKFPCFLAASATWPFRTGRRSGNRPNPIRRGDLCCISRIRPTTESG